MDPNFDSDAARRRYQELSDEALVRIAYGDKGYAPVAVALAQRELETRGIASSAHPLVEATQRSDLVEASDKKNTELHGALKALCFILPGCLSLIIAVWQWASGRHRAAKDALMWTLFGVLTWVSIGLVLTFVGPAP